MFGENPSIMASRNETPLSTSRKTAEATSMVQNGK